MAEEKPVHEQVQELLDRWNKPPEEHNLSRLIGEPTSPEDTRATAAVNYTDARTEQAYADDAERRQTQGWVYGDDLDDLDKPALKEQAGHRGLAQSGSKGDLKERIVAFDNGDDDEDDDSDDDSEE